MGSEMCIRDSPSLSPHHLISAPTNFPTQVDFAPTRLHSTRDRELVMTSRSAFVGLSFWILLGGQLCSLFGQAPAQPSWSLTDQIDRLVTQSTGVSEWTLASDATLIRRVTLDLVGETPATSEVRAFIVDASPEKYVQLVDRLLSDPRHSRRMADWLDLTLMERRAKVHIDLAEWKAYLENAFQDQRTLDSIVRDCLLYTSDAADE